MFHFGIVSEYESVPSEYESVPFWHSLVFLSYYGKFFVARSFLLYFILDNVNHEAYCLIKDKNTPNERCIK